MTVMNIQVSIQNSQALSPAIMHKNKTICFIDRDQRSNG